MSPSLSSNFTQIIEQMIGEVFETSLKDRNVTLIIAQTLTIPPGHRLFLCYKKIISLAYNQFKIDSFTWKNVALSAYRAQRWIQECHQNTCSQ